MRHVSELVERCQFAWMALEMQLNARRELGGCDQRDYTNAELERLARTAQGRARQRVFSPAESAALKDGACVTCMADGVTAFALDRAYHARRTDHEPQTTGD